MSERNDEDLEAPPSIYDELDSKLKRVLFLLDELRIEVDTMRRELKLNLEHAEALSKILKKS